MAAGARLGAWRLTGGCTDVRSTAGRCFDAELRWCSCWCAKSMGIHRTSSGAPGTSGDAADADFARWCEWATPIPTSAIPSVTTASRGAHDWGWGSRPRPRTTGRVVNIILEIGSGLTLTLQTTSSCRASPSTSWSHKVLAPLNAQLACHPTRAHSRACPLQAWFKPSWTSWT